MTETSAEILGRLRSAAGAHARISAWGAHHIRRVWWHALESAGAVA